MSTSHPSQAFQTAPRKSAPAEIAYLLSQAEHTDRLFGALGRGLARLTHALAMPARAAPGVVDKR